MATAKFDIKTEALKPVLAGVGVTDLAVEAVREYVTDVQTRVRGYQKSVASVDLQPKALRDQAVTVVSDTVDSLAALSGDVKTVPAKVQTIVDENRAALNDTYGDLVKRGESLVGRIRRQQSTQATVKSAETTVSKAKTTAKATAKKATSTAKKQSASSKSSAKATVTAAKKTASSATQAVTDAAEKVGD
jgi:hypothetical protein